MALTSEQRSVIFVMSTAIVTTAFALIGSDSCPSWRLTEAQAALGDRLALLAISELPLSLPLTASIARLANYRFPDPRDIGGSTAANQTDQVLVF